MALYYSLFLYIDKVMSAFIVGLKESKTVQLLLCNQLWDLISMYASFIFGESALKVSGFHMVPNVT